MSSLPSLLTAVLAVALATTPALAAPASPTHVSLEVAGTAFQLKEGLYNGILYQGWLPAGRASFEAWHDAWAHTGRLSAGVGNLANRFEDPLLLIDGQVAYGWATRVRPVGAEGLRVYWGGAASGTTTLYQFTREDADHVYWFTRYGLALLGLASLALPGDSIATARVEVPVLALASRPPAARFYNNDKPDAGYLLRKIHEGLAPATLIDYPAIDAELAYTFPIGPRVTESIVYRFGWGSYLAPSPVQWMSHSVALRLGYAF